MDLISTLEQEEIARLNKKIPAFAPGDTVIVSVNVVEGTRKRVQAFEGVVIAKRNRSLNSSFIVRKVSNGEGVERTFQLYSPIIAGIEVKRRGDVRQRRGIEHLSDIRHLLLVDNTVADQQRLGAVAGVELHRQVYKLKDHNRGKQPDAQPNNWLLPQYEAEEQQQQTDIAAKPRHRHGRVAHDQGPLA